MCYFTYSYIFGFGMHGPDATDPKPLRVEIANDVDSFTRGTLKLADWCSKTFVEQKENMGSKITRVRRIFFNDSANADKPQKKDDP